MRSNLKLLSFVLPLLAPMGCTNDSSSDSGGSYTYGSTSTKGDYATWTISGDSMSIEWQVPSATGAINYTYSISATCGSENATYHYKTCTVSSASCTAGALACSGTPTAGTTFDMMAVPGVAIFVHTGSGTANEQLHVGVVADANACSSDISGTYVFIRTALGEEDLFGMYSSDSNFTTVNHADFRMSAGSSTATPTIVYNAGGGTGTGLESLTGSSCSNGLRTRTLSGSQIRSMMTASGLFILDLPSGSGGLVSFKTSNAASISDFASKSFSGISFPDNSTPQAIAATSGALSSGAVSLTANVGGSTINLSLKPFSDATSAATNPAYPSFTAAPTNYTNNTGIRPNYATPSVFPGMFRIDNADNFASDTGRVLLAGMKYNNKVIAFGVVYNWRTTGMTKPDGSNFGSNNLYNTGNFLLFER